MTATLEEDMNQIAAGNKTQKDVVDLSRDILNDVLRELLPHQEEVKDARRTPSLPDAYVGPCRSADATCNSAHPERRIRCSSAVPVGLNATR